MIPIADAIGADEVLGNAHNVLGNALAWLGRPGADDEFRRALAIYEQRGFVPGQAMVYLNLGATAYWEGRWSDAAELYQRALELHTRTTNPIEAAFAAMNIAEIYLEQGKLDEAEALLRDASRELRSSGEFQGLAGSLTYLGRVQARAGRLAEAEELLRQARETYDRAGMKAGALEVDALEAERLVMAARPAEALARAEATLAHGHEDLGVEVLAPMLERTRGYALAQLGQVDGACAALDRSVELARDRDAPYEVSLSLQGIVRLEQQDSRELTAGRYAEMREIFERLGVIATPVYPILETPPEGRGLESADADPT